MAFKEVQNEGVMNLTENAGNQPEGKMRQGEIISTEIELAVPEVSQESGEEIGLSEDKIVESNEKSMSIATQKIQQCASNTGSSTKDDIAIQKEPSKSERITGTVYKEISKPIVFQQIQNIHPNKNEVQIKNVQSVLGQSTVSSSQLRRAATSFGGSIMNTSFLSRASGVGSTIITGMTLPAGILANVIAGISELSSAISKSFDSRAKKRDLISALEIIGLSPVEAVDSMDDLQITKISRLITVEQASFTKCLHRLNISDERKS